MKPLPTILSTIASHQLESLEFRSSSFPFDHVPSIDRILATLDGLKDVDTLLSRPQFHRLQYLKFNLGFHVTIPRRSVESGAQQDTSGMISFLPPCSHSSPHLDDSDTTDDIRDTFRRHATEAVQRKIEEVLKQFKSRGILDLDVHISLFNQPSMKTINESSRSIEASATDTPSSAVNTD